jgi:hypothetical protein
MRQPTSETLYGDAPLSAANSEALYDEAVSPHKDDVLGGRCVTIDEIIDERPAHWTIAAPAGNTVECDSLIIH